jgi:hypothetical protein
MQSSGRAFVLISTEIKLIGMFKKCVRESPFLMEFCSLGSVPSDSLNPISHCREKDTKKGEASITIHTHQALR